MLLSDAQLRLEKFTLFWMTTDVIIPKRSQLVLGSGANIYGAVDWVSVAMSADETVDLRDPKVRVYPTSCTQLIVLARASFSFSGKNTCSA